MNSLDGVSDRDYAVELASDSSICMMHLSRFSEEIILWFYKNEKVFRNILLLYQIMMR